MVSFPPLLSFPFILFLVRTGKIWIAAACYYLPCVTSRPGCLYEFSHFSTCKKGRDKSWNETQDKQFGTTLKTKRPAGDVKAATAH